MARVWILLTVLATVVVSAPAQSVLTWNLTSSEADGRTSMFSFDLDKFTEFYGCLCKNTTKTCRAYASDVEVTYVDFSSMDVSQLRTYNNSARYECYTTTTQTYIICTRSENIKEGDSMLMDRCVSYRINSSFACDHEPVELVWRADYDIQIWHNETVIQSKQCTDGDIDTTTTSPSDIPIFETSVKTSMSRETEEEDHDEKDKDSSTIIIAAVVSVILVLVIALITGLALWRHKRKGTSNAGSTIDQSSSSAATSEISSSTLTSSVNEFQTSTESFRGRDVQQHCGPHEQDSTYSNGLSPAQTTAAATSASYANVKVQRSSAESPNGVTNTVAKSCQKSPYYNQIDVMEDSVDDRCIYDDNMEDSDLDSQGNLQNTDSSTAFGNDNIYVDMGHGNVDLYIC